MCSENFQEMSPKKKIENKQSDIKLTWSNHKNNGFCCDHEPSSLRAFIQSIDSYQKHLQRLDTDLSNNKNLPSVPFEQGLRVGF